MAGVNPINSTGNNEYVSSYSKRSIPQKIIDFFTGTSKTVYQMKDYAELKSKKSEIQEVLKVSCELQKLQKAEDAPLQKRREAMYGLLLPFQSKETKELLEKLEETIKQSSEQKTFSELLKDPVFRKYTTQM